MAKPPILVTGVTTGRWGRFILSSGVKHIVADATAPRGGPGEGFGAGELVMASLCSCGLALVVEAARELGLPKLEAQIECSYVTDPTDRTRWSELTAVLRVAGVDAATAQGLLGAFIDICPIWNTLARTTPHSSRVELTA